MTDDKYEELAVRSGTVRRGAAASTAARSTLMEATGATNPQEAVQLAIGLPPRRREYREEV